MFQYIYSILAEFGYHHPLHPAFVHLTIGMVVGAFIFGFIAWILQKKSMTQTARHCIGLALISVIPTAFLGYGDWQHFLGGAWIVPIRWKLILTAALFAVLIIACLSGKKLEKISFGQLFIYLIGLLIVVVIGYFGAELVHGKRVAVSEKQPNEELVLKGAEIFSKNCSFCHATDTTATKIGPGFKGIFRQDKFEVSQWPVTRQSVEKQLKTPFGNMPAFEKFDDKEIDALVAYLKSL